MAIIEEQAKKIAIPRIEVREKLHGHTTIDLFNVHTKKYERFEHDNTFTDGIESYMSDLGVFMRSPLGNGTVYGRELWKSLLGGILLFDKELPTSPMAKYMPAGTTMTANGSYGVSNSGNPSELGSYNSIESSVGSDYISLVYDWGTSQGNGEIASVALTTQDGGYIGYGNNSRTNGSLRALNNLQDNNLGVRYYTTNSIGYAIIHGGKIYVMPSELSSGATSVKCYYKYINLFSVDIFVTQNVITTSDNDGEITFSIPALSGNYCCVPYSPTKFALIPIVNSVGNGSSFTIHLLDVINETVSSKTITNNTGATIYSSNSGNGLYVYPIDDTYALVCCSNGKVYKINMNTSELIGEVSNVSYGNGWGNQRKWIGNTLHITDELMNINQSGADSPYLYDPVLNRALPTNGKLSYTNGSNGANELYGYMDGDFLTYCRWGNSGAQAGYCCYHNPLRLMTINNLDDTVTKDASKTMKVTYTVTRSA